MNNRYWFKPTGQAQGAVVRRRTMLRFRNPVTGEVRRVEARYGPLPHGGGYGYVPVSQSGVSFDGNVVRVAWDDGGVGRGLLPSIQGSFVSGDDFAKLHPSQIKGEIGSPPGKGVYVVVGRRSAEQQGKFNDCIAEAKTKYANAVDDLNGEAEREYGKNKRNYAIGFFFLL